MRNYGPFEPLSDPHQHEKLRMLLSAGGLLPRDVGVDFSCPGKTTIEVSYRERLSIEGISSSTPRGKILLNAMVIADREVLSDADVGIFNLGHLVPMQLGCFSNVEPLLINATPISGAPPLPRLALTLWCKPAPVTENRSGTIGTLPERSVSPTLLKALRLLKINNVVVEDAELCSALDLYSAFL